MSDSEEKTPTVSPDQGATGEATTSSGHKEVGTQTGWLSIKNYKCMKKGSSQQQQYQQLSSITFFESEAEKEAHLDEIECNAIMGMLNSLKERNPEAYRDVLIETLYKHFARENRATRSTETIFSELDKLEAREAEYLETSDHVPNGLQMDLKFAREDVEFENYVTLLKEARAQFGREMEAAVILYVIKHKGEPYCLSCMSRRHKQ